MRFALIAVLIVAIGAAPAMAGSCVPRTKNDNGTVITVTCDGNKPVYSVSTVENKTHSTREAQRLIGELRKEDEQRAAEQAEMVAAARKAQQACILELGADASVAEARKACPLETAAPATILPEQTAAPQTLRSDRGNALRSDRNTGRQ